MALVVFDRVKETSNSTGTGTIVLDGAQTGYQSFAVVGNANTTYYTIAGQTTGQWEVGIGTYYTANTSLARTTILASSAANAAVTFSAGAKDVFITYPAERSVNIDATGNVSSYKYLGGSIDNITIGATTANSGAFTTLSATGLITGSANVNIDAGTFFVDSTNNRVGVGTTTPGYLFQVTGAPAATSGSLISLRDTTAAVGTPSLGAITFFSSPGTDYYVGKKSDTAGNATLSFGNADTGAEYANISSNGNLAVDTNTLYVDAVNNFVGIGTTAPAAPLDVAGASNTTVTARVYNANTNSATATALMLNTGGRYVQQTVNYGSSYYYISSVNIPTWYSNFDTYNFRNTGSAVQVAISSTASANNYVNLTGGLGVGPTISAAGADTNIDLKLTPKGTGYANITSGGIKFPDATVQTTAAVAGIPAAGNSSIGVFNTNITANATISTGTNGLSIGPVTTANGVTVTVGANATWLTL